MTKVKFIQVTCDEKDPHSIAPSAFIKLYIYKLIPESTVCALKKYPYFYAEFISFLEYFYLEYFARIFDTCHHCLHGAQNGLYQKKNNT